MTRYAILEDTLYFWFGANDTSGSGGDGFGPAFQIRCGGDADDDPATIFGIPTLLTSINYNPGCYEIEVEATVANGFTAGKSYGVFCNLAIDGQNPTGKVGEFTLSPIPSDVVQVAGDSDAADGMKLGWNGVGKVGDQYPATQEQVSNISTSSGGFGRLISAFVPDGAEPETNTFLATQQGDGIYHIVEPDGTTIGCYYQANIGGTGVATSFEWRGYMRSQGSSIAVKYYNWATPGDPWKFIKIRTGTQPSVAVDDVFSVPTGATGTGANAGLVRLRFESTDATHIATDFLQCVFSNTFSAVGYQGGQIFIDTIAGFAGSVVNINGVGDHACDNLIDALSISVQTTMREFHIASGSVIDLISDATGMVGRGVNWHLGLEGQIITGGYVTGATVTGSAHISSTGSHFHDCHIGDGTAIVGVGPSTFEAGSIDTTEAFPLTFLSAGSYRFLHMASGVPGSDAPWINLGVGTGVVTAEFRWWSGGLSLINVGVDKIVSVDALTGGTVTLGMTGGHVEARGAGMKELIVNGTSGTVNVAGFYGTITDNTAGAVTISKIWTFQALFVAMFAGITNMAAWLRGLFRKDTMDPTAKTEVNIGGGTFDEATASGEGTVDHGDVEWKTGTVGDLSIIVSPIAGTLSERMTSPVVTLVQAEHIYYGPWVITDSDKNPVDVSGLDLTFTVYNLEGPVVEQWQLTEAAGEIVVSGDDNNQVTLIDDDSHTQESDRLGYTLWDSVNVRPIQRHVLEIVRSTGP